MSKRSQTIQQKKKLARASRTKKPCGAPARPAIAAVIASGDSAVDRLRDVRNDLHVNELRRVGTRDGRIYAKWGGDVGLALAEIERLLMVEEDHRQAGEIIIDLKREIEGLRSGGVAFWTHPVAALNATAKEPFDIQTLTKPKASVGAVATAQPERVATPKPWWRRWLP